MPNTTKTSLPTSFELPKINPLRTVSLDATAAAELTATEQVVTTAQNESELTRSLAKQLLQKSQIYYTDKTDPDKDTWSQLKFYAEQNIVTIYDASRPYIQWGKRKDIDLKTNEGLTEFITLVKNINDRSNNYYSSQNCQLKPYHVDTLCLVGEKAGLFGNTEVTHSPDAISLTLKQIGKVFDKLRIEYFTKGEDANRRVLVSRKGDQVIFWEAKGPYFNSFEQTSVTSLSNAASNPEALDKLLGTFKFVRTEGCFQEDNKPGDYLDTCLILADAANAQHSKKEAAAEAAEEVEQTQAAARQLQESETRVVSAGEKAAREEAAETISTAIYNFVAKKRAKIETKVQIATEEKTGEKSTPWQDRVAESNYTSVSPAL